ncbi:MAG: hypothetical protein KTR25_07335 [Myxococcales bacterium]|nr:hypothetical protein [Myxococcales bacterium]
MNKWMVSFGGSLLALGLVASCEDNQLIPLGGLGRPSGMAYVPRSAVSIDDGLELRRADLLIADSEAQGVRVLQFSEVLGENNEVSGWVRSFIQGPAVFLKLAADAPGYPERVEVAPAVGEVPAYAFVLGVTRGQLHILEVADLPFQTSAVNETNVRKGSVDLLSIAEEVNGIPIDIALQGRTNDGASERVLIAFDGLGNASGTLLQLDVSITEFGQAEEVARVAVDSGVTDMLYRTEENTVLLSGAGFQEVTEGDTTRRVYGISEVPLADDGTLSSPRPVIDAGGPTYRLVSFGTTGALALRIDRSAVVWLEPTDNGFARSTQILYSPFDGDTPREPGVLAVEEPLAVAAAYAKLDSLGVRAFAGAGLVNLGFIFDGDEERDVVLLAHAHGFASYVVGSDAQGSDGTVPRVGVIDDGREVTFLASPPLPGTTSTEPLLVIDGCEDQYQEACVDATANSTEPICTNRLLRRERVAAGAIVRVAANGELVSGLNAAFQFEGALVDQPPSEENEISVEVVDRSTPNFFGVPLIRTEADAAPGGPVPDVLRVELRLRCDEAQDTTLPPTVIVFTGEVQQVDLEGQDRRGDNLVEPDDLTDIEAVEGLRIQANLDTVVAAYQGPMSVADVINVCATALSGGTPDAPKQINARRVLVHMPQDADEAVLVGASGQQLVGVYERVDIQEDADGAAEMRFGEGQEDENDPGLQISPVRMTVRGPEGLESLRCESRVPAQEIGTLPSYCLSTEQGGVNDCGGELSADARWLCPAVGDRSSFCSFACQCSPDDDSCEIGSFFTYNCPRLDMALANTRASLNLRLVNTRSNVAAEGSGIIPDDVVFHEQLESFFVSFPGAQSLIEVPTSTAALSRIR